MVELLPCPFCGGDNTELAYQYGDTTFVNCIDCLAQGPSASWGRPSGWETKDIAKQKAIEMWNQRVITDEEKYAIQLEVLAPPRARKKPS